MSNLQISVAEIAKKQNEIVQSVIGNGALMGFERAYAVAEGIARLKEMLTPEYMAPIMELRGTKLGFRTDKDRNKDGSPGLGYPVDVVRVCLIEAVFFGLQPYGNQFNIISGSMYPTKEGLEYLLNNWPGLKYTVVPLIPKVSQDKSSAVIDVRIKWTHLGESDEETIVIPLKTDQWTSIDAMHGKAKRKAYAWLRSKITGEATPEGEVDDQGPANVVGTEKVSQADEAKERLRKAQGEQGKTTLL